MTPFSIRLKAISWVPCFQWSDSGSVALSKISFKKKFYSAGPFWFEPKYCKISFFTWFTTIVMQGRSNEQKWLKLRLDWSSVHVFEGFFYVTRWWDNMWCLCAFISRKQINLNLCVMINTIDLYSISHNWLCFFTQAVLSLWNLIPALRCFILWLLIQANSFFSLVLIHFSASDGGPALAILVGLFPNLETDMVT